MKEKWHDSLCRFLLRAGFIALAALLIIPLICYSPVQAESVVCTPTAAPDSDGDGFSDAEETGGLTINGILYPTDPTIPDAFVEIDPDFFNSLFPHHGTDLLAYLKDNGLQVDGKAIMFHELPENTVDSERRIPLGRRNDGTCQKAVKIVEYRTNAGDCYTILGETEQGPPNNKKGPVYIFTDRITCFVNEEYLCGSENTCKIALKGIKSAQEINHRSDARHHRA